MGLMSVWQNDVCGNNGEKFAMVGASLRLFTRESCCVAERLQRLRCNKIFDFD